MYEERKEEGEIQYIEYIVISVHFFFVLGQCHNLGAWNYLYVCCNKDESTNVKDIGNAKTEKLKKKLNFLYATIKCKTTDVH